MARQTVTIANSTSWLNNVQRSYEPSIVLDGALGQTSGTRCRLIQFLGLAGTQRISVVFSDPTESFDRNLTGALLSRGSVTLTNAGGISVTLNFADADNSSQGFYVFTSGAATAFAITMSAALADSALTVTFDNNVVTGEAEEIAQTFSVGRPVGGRPAVIGLPGQAYIQDIGRRTRTRANGSVSEWSGTPLPSIPTPFAIGSDAQVTRLRLSRDNLQFRSGSGPTSFTAEFLRRGIFIFSAANGEVRLPGPHSFASGGNYTGTLSPEYMAWWDEFSSANRLLTVGFALEGLYLEYGTLKVTGVVDPTVRGDGTEIAVELSLGRAHAFAHAEFVQVDHDTGEPEAFLRSVAGGEIAAAFSVGQPSAYAHAAPITIDHDTDEPEGFLSSVAGDEITAAFSVGRPDVVQNVWTTTLQPNWYIADAATRRWVAANNQRPVVPEGLSDPAFAATILHVVNLRIDSDRLFLNFSVDQTNINRADLSSQWETAGWVSIRAGEGEFRFSVTDSEANLVTSAGADPYGWGFTGELLANFEAFRDTVLSGTSGAQSAEFTLWDGLGSSPFPQPEPVEPAPLTLNFALGRAHAFAHAEFVQADLDTGEPATYLRSVAGGEVAAEQDTGEPEARRYGVPASLTVNQDTGEPEAFLRSVAGDEIAFEHDVGEPDGLQRRVVAPAAIRFALDTGTPRGTILSTAGTPRIVLHFSDRAVGLVSTPVEAITLNLDTGTPISVVGEGTFPAVAEFSTERPQAFLRSVAGDEITAAFSVGQPHAHAHAVSITLNLDTGEPAGLIASAPEAITVSYETGTPYPYAYAEDITVRYSLGRPIAIGEEGVFPRIVAFSTGRPQTFLRSVAGDEIALAYEAGQPHSLVHAEEAVVEWSVERPNPLVRSRAALPITLDHALGRAHAFAHAEFVQVDLDTGEPRGYIPRIAGDEITVTWGVGVPVAFAFGTSITYELDTEAPAGVLLSVAAQGVALEFESQRIFSPALAVRITLDLAISRPTATVFGRPQDITVAHSTERLIVFRTVAAQGVALELAPGQPTVFNHGDELIVEHEAGQPRGYIPRVAADTIAFDLNVGIPQGFLRSVAGDEIRVEQETGQPHVYAHADRVTVGLRTGRARGYFLTIPADEAIWVPRTGSPIGDIPVSIGGANSYSLNSGSAVASAINRRVLPFFAQSQIFERCIRRFVEDCFNPLWASDPYNTPRPPGFPDRVPAERLSQVEPALNRFGVALRRAFEIDEFEVIPGNSPGPRPLPEPDPRAPYASLLLIDDERRGYPIRRQLPDGTTVDLVYRRAKFSLQFYRDGSHEFARAFDAWCMSENGLTYADSAFSDGRIVRVSLIDGGSGYTEPPDILIDGDGEGASAQASVQQGRVVGVTMRSFGYGYTLPPKITFVGGGGTGARASARGLGFRVHFPNNLRRLDAVEADRFEKRTAIDLTIDYAETQEQDTGLIDSVDCNVVMGGVSEVGRISIGG